MGRLTHDDHIIYLKSDGSLWRLRRGDSEPGEEMRLPDKAFQGRWDVWRNTVMYQRREPDQDVLVLFDVGSGALVEQPLGFKAALGMSISPDGRAIAVPKRLLESDLWIVDAYP